jgi:hypothetical protein
VIVDAKSTVGRTVWFGESQRATMKLSGIKITQSERSFVDATTQEPIYHYYRLEAKGGWLVRTIGMSDGVGPLLFPSTCQPKNLDKIDVQLGNKHISRPISS